MRFTFQEKGSPYGRAELARMFEEEGCAVTLSQNGGLTAEMPAWELALLPVLAQLAERVPALQVFNETVQIDLKDGRAVLQFIYWGRANVMLHTLLTCLIALEQLFGKSFTDPTTFGLALGAANALVFALWLVGVVHARMTLVARVARRLKPAVKLASE